MFIENFTKTMKTNKHVNRLKKGRKKINKLIEISRKQGNLLNKYLVKLLNCQEFLLMGLHIFFKLKLNLIEKLKKCIY